MFKIPVHLMVLSLFSVMHDGEQVDVESFQVSPNPSTFFFLSLLKSSLEGILQDFKPFPVVSLAKTYLIKHILKFVVKNKHR